MVVVVQEGVYRHDIMGVFDGIEDAKMFAIECLAREEDNYHHFVGVDVGAINHPTGEVVVFRVAQNRKREIKFFGEDNVNMWGWKESCQ